METQGTRELYDPSIKGAVRHFSHNSRRLGAIAVVSSVSVYSSLSEGFGALEPAVGNTCHSKATECSAWQRTHTHRHTHTHTLRHTHTYTLRHIHTYTHTLRHTHTYTHACTRTNTYDP